MRIGGGVRPYLASCFASTAVPHHPSALQPPACASGVGHCYSCLYSHATHPFTSWVNVENRLHLGVVCNYNSSRLLLCLWTGTARVPPAAAAAVATETHLPSSRRVYAFPQLHKTARSSRRAYAFPRLYETARCQVAVIMLSSPGALGA